MRFHAYKVILTILIILIFEKDVIIYAFVMGKMFAWSNADVGIIYY